MFYMKFCMNLSKFRKIRDFSLPWGYGTKNHNNTCLSPSLKVIVLGGVDIIIQEGMSNFTVLKRIWFIFLVIWVSLATSAFLRFMY